MHTHGTPLKLPALVIETHHLALFRLIGTAANSLVTVFNRIVERKQAQLTYVIPISDNGGSSSELIRVIGGPSEYNQRCLDCIFEMGLTRITYRCG